MKMILPANWDKPSEGNDLLCKKFERHTFRNGEKTLPYRLFIPGRAVRSACAERTEKYPLLLYLHGADAAGDDNEIHLSMHDIGTYPAGDEMQSKHPCYILAPQYGEMKHWAMPEIREPLWELLTEVIEGREDIDRQRIYVYGYSAGGVGLLKLLKEAPGIFAAAVSICGATGLTDIDRLLITPLWMVHAADDAIVKASYRTDRIHEPANLGSADIYDHFAKSQGAEADKYGADGKDISTYRIKKYAGEKADLRYTEYAAGYMSERIGVNPHCSWVMISDEKSREIWEWMFLKRRKDDII
ncbi:MAG: prolyl oligopeptidase family serine peptidase [Lachnospiraceae bacterium]|nr:prolyl oligopeptidase family serine peptidase [Lachnospiraceae bacterium]